MESIWHYRSRSSDLVGTVIDVHNGDWIRRGTVIRLFSYEIFICQIVMKLVIFMS